MRNVFAAVLMISTLGLPAHAQSLRTENGIGVTGLSNNSFSIGARGSSTGIWCAAADYSLRALGATRSTRIIVKTPRSAQNNAIVFSTDPSLRTKAAKGLTTSGGKLKTAGANFSVGTAYQFCIDRRSSNRP